MTKKSPCLSTLRRKAAKAGYTLSKGHRRYLNRKWGFVIIDGHKIDGYMLINQEAGCPVWQCYSEIFEYALSLEDVTSVMKGIGIL